ncbi:MAG: protein translocase subunit SecD [Lentisphaeria bacterium]|nr:protein translocase subunit SecD [Lentisphaeria bacterium]
MNKRPLMLRTAIVLVVIAVFASAMYPLFPRNYYDAFQSLLKDKNDKAALELVEYAKGLQAKDAELYPSQALLQAASDKNMTLTDRVKGEGLQDNRDVMSLIRKHASSSIRLGLDLNGGVEFMLQLVPDQEFLAKVKNQKGDGETAAEIESRMQSEFDRYRDVAIEILRKRLEGQKIYEAEIAPSGSDYVALRAPIVTKDEKLKLMNLIQMSAKLNFRLVHPDNMREIQAYLADPKAYRVPVGYELMKTTEFDNNNKIHENYTLVSKRSEMTGKGVSSAYAYKDEFGQRKITLRFNPDGARDFARVTGANVGRQLAIVLDGQLYSAPTINGPIPSGSAEITGQFTEEEAKSIADALVSGSFPFQIKVNAVFDTDPTLGASNVKNGIWVGFLSLVCVAIFMIIYYRTAGIFTIVALVLNILLILGALAAFDCTLTLPGIAGIVLTIGMAVDANVLVFERIREELQSGKSLRTSVDQGYSRALSSVLDANITTLITAFILMYVGTGAIKGFAITLSIGILTSLFTALFVSRLLFDYLFRYVSGFDKLDMLCFFKNPNINFNRLWPILNKFTLLMLIASFALFFVKGKNMLGVDFTGGTQVTFNYSEQIPKEKLEAVLRKAGYDATVNYKYNAAAASEKAKVQILVRGDLTKASVDSSPKDALAKLLNNAFPAAKLSGGEETSVGGLIGREFTKYALIAIALSIVGILVYVSIRYEFFYALSSVLALAHDVIIVLGIYLALGRTISLSTVAAILTVIGYSINDSVVIFDRIRENLRNDVCKTFAETVNLSINQTLNRTMLTTLTTFISVFILFIAGGVAINDFVLIMMLGVIVGTYSSVFIAAPLVNSWYTRQEKRRKHN